jgi:hypothetical protein
MFLHNSVVFCNILFLYSMASTFTFGDFLYIRTRNIVLRGKMLVKAGIRSPFNEARYRNKRSDYVEVNRQAHAPPALPPRKRTRSLLNKRLSRFQSPSGRCGEERNILPLTEIEPLFLEHSARCLSLHRHR